MRINSNVFQTITIATESETPTVFFPKHHTLMPVTFGDLSSYVFFTITAGQSHPELVPKTLDYLSEYDLFVITLFIFMLLM